jgi:hypothetical protein
VQAFAGQKPAVYTTELDQEMKPVTSVGVDQTADLRSRLHESYTWSLPPRENLAYAEDLVTLEPLLIIMGQSELPRAAAAAMVGLPVALNVFVHHGHDVNAAVAGTGMTALHYACRRADFPMIRQLLETEAVELNKADKHGATALHYLVQVPYQTALEMESAADSNSAPFLDTDKMDDDQRKKYELTQQTVALLVAKGADPMLPNKNGVTALDTHAEWSDDTTMFPGLEEQFKDSVEKLTKSFVVAMPDEKFAALLKEANITRTEHAQKFDNGNTITWEEYNPSTEPLDLVCIVPFSAGGCSIQSGRMDNELVWNTLSQMNVKVVCLHQPGQKAKCIIGEGGIKHLADEEVSKRFFSHETSQDMMDYYWKDMYVVAEQLCKPFDGAHWIGCGCLSSLFVERVPVSRPHLVKTCTAFGFMAATRFTPKMQEMMKMCFGLVTEAPTEVRNGMFTQVFSNMVHKRAPQDLLNLVVQCVEESGYESRLNFILFGLYAHFTNVFDHTEIKSPFLIISGAGSAQSLEAADHALRLIPHAEHAIIGRCGQLPQIERTQEVVDEISAFLRKSSFGGCCKDAGPQV